MKYCSNCGKELSDQMTFCPDCGKAVSNMPEANTDIPLSTVHVSADKPKKKWNKNVIIAVGVVIAAVIILVLFNVFGAPPVESISLSKTEINMTPGESTSISYKIEPEEARNVRVIWHSSNESIATIDREGKITAVGDGTCEITATAQDMTASLAVNVIQIQPEIKIVLGTWKSSFAQTDDTAGYFDAGSLVLNKDGTGELTIGTMKTRIISWRYDGYLDGSNVYSTTTDGLPIDFSYDLDDEKIYCFSGDTIAIVFERD